MPFHVAPSDRPTRVAAGMVIAAFGAGFVLAPAAQARAFGYALAGGGLGLSAYHGYAALRERRRRDPYDLSTLWDEPLPEADPEVTVTDQDVALELVYCHRCGAAMPETFSICADCGNRLGY